MAVERAIRQVYRTRQHDPDAAFELWRATRIRILDHPDLGELVRRVGSLQIRNVGTLAGNVANASPIGDTLPALLALDASLVLQQGKARREVPLDGFFAGYRRTGLRPGEVITAIRLPVRSAERAFRAYKVSKRFDQDISAVCGAFPVTLAAGRVREVRIAYGGVAATPLRALAVEQAATGKPWNLETSAQLAADLGQLGSPLSDHRGSAEYRRAMLGRSFEKFFAESRQRAEEAAP